MQYDNLFSPFKIGTKTAKNRIIFPAHGIPTALPFCADDADGERYIAYEATRAKGSSDKKDKQYYHSENNQASGKKSPEESSHSVHANIASICSSV